MEQNDVLQPYYPDKEEIRAAQLACCGRHCSACESPAEYAWRKREVDMALLLEKAIEKELSEAEKDAIMLHWYDGESVTEISQKKGVNPSAVKRTLDRAQEKLEKALVYAVFYQQNVISESIIPVALGRAKVISAARNAKGGRIGDRIARLRQGQCLTVKAVSNATDIKQTRLFGIERGAEPETDEIVALSEFFSVTTDYILKGEKNVEKENFV